MKRADQVMAYGIHAVTHALSDGSATDLEGATLLLQSGRTDAKIKALSTLAQSRKVATEVLDRKELDDVVRGRHQGAVLMGHRRQEDAADLDSILARRGQQTLLLVLDGVQDPHNLGACLRSADAAGADAVIVPRRRAAGLGASARKVAAGAAENIPLIAVTNLARTLRSLGEHGVRLVGTAGEAEKPLYGADLRGPLALVMGGEEKGLRRLTREHCDELVYLPMAGAVSSLNVSVAAGICLFEAVRQRQYGR